MKLVVIVLAVFAVSVLSAPADDADLAAVDHILSHLQDNVFLKSEQKIFRKVLINSLDKKCIYDHYNDNHLLQHMTVEEIFENEPSDMNPFYASINVFSLCSSKLDVLSEFLFENIRTNRILYKAFVDEPSLKNFTDYIWCANKFAVENHFIDEVVYGQKLKVADDNNESCDEMMEIIKVGLSIYNLATRRKLNTPCVIRPLIQFEKAVFKTILMVQVDLTHEQQRLERENFVQVIRNLLEGTLKCASKPKSKIPFIDHFSKKYELLD